MRVKYYICFYTIISRIINKSSLIDILYLSLSDQVWRLNRINKTINYSNCLHVFTIQLNLFYNIEKNYYLEKFITLIVLLY